MSKSKSIITRNEIEDIKSDIENMKTDIKTLEDFVLKLVKVSPYFDNGDDEIPEPTKPQFKNMQGFRPKEEE
tara:strand:- start:2654 stop:2869 length:216 start_codon:yes stop_codon:yes gene_type:complete